MMVLDLGAQRQPIKENDLPNIVEFLSLGHESQNIHYSKKSELLNDPVFNLSGKQKRELEIQTDFEMVRVGELVEIQSGYAFQSKQFNESEGIPLIRIRNIKTNKTKTLYSGEYSDEYIVNNGDLLVGMDGEFNAVIWQGGKALLNQRVCKLLSNEKVLPYYLFLIIQKTLKEIEEDTFAVTVKHISVKQIKDIEIPLPPLEVQQEIVDELEGYQKIIDGCKQVVENYKPTIDIDPSWEMVELGEVYESNFDSKRIPITKSDREEGDIPYYGASGIVDYVKDFIFDEELLLVSEDGANLKDRNYPIAFSISGKSWVNNHAHVLKFGSYENQKFIEFYLNNISLEPYITGAAQPKVNQSALNSIKVPNPLMDIQKEIVQKIEEERTVIEGNKKLIEIYTQKIQNRINKVWGEE